jgi:hypothetical protein
LQVPDQCSQDRQSRILAANEAALHDVARSLRHDSFRHHENRAE